MTTQANWMRRGALGALALGAAIPVGVTAAGPASAAPRTGAATASSTRTLTRSVDVDGDGRRDTVRVTWSTKNAGTTVSVRTAKNKTSSIHVDTAAPQQGDEPWVGSASVDGVRGADLVLFNGLGDVSHYSTYTWRNGGLTQLRAPGDTTGSVGWVVSAGAEGIGWEGYSFGTTRGVRTTTHWELPTKTRSGRWYGTATQYRWSAKGWVKDSTTKQSVTTTGAHSAYLFGGLTLTH